MVVGVGSYKDTKEAFPLDKKTLNKVALRSFFSSAAKNSETAESIGWCWAMLPALQKIHTNEEDLALCMGHELEYVDTGSFFSTIAMGAVLAMEQQKLDLETIRSLRTTMMTLCQGLSNACMQCFVFALIGLGCASFAVSGSLLPVIVFACVSVILTVFLRFIGIRIGYSQSTKIIEKLTKHQQQLQHASRIAGVFTIGALIVLTSYYVTPGSTFGITTTLYTSQVSIVSLVQRMMPGIFGVITTLVIYHFLTKKNFSIVQCVCLIVLISIVLALIGQAMTFVALS